MFSFEKEYCDEVSRTITYAFQVTIDWDSYSWYISWHLDDNEVYPNYTLMWDTPGHPELDEEEENKFISELVNGI